ncbi:unnamed protein product [Phyllotreta striolata]|uniref:Uncharacterized protein n=1 Tax=Phyllotreta striolata TaxID=444603 RepID=A0A9N9XIA6_PHYSR|nr:unnamed protein product [Phyllotreta striolata]
MLKLVLRNLFCLNAEAGNLVIKYFQAHYFSAESDNSVIKYFQAHYFSAEADNSVIKYFQTHYFSAKADNSVIKYFQAHHFSAESGQIRNDKHPTDEMKKKNRAKIGHSCGQDSALCGCRSAGSTGERAR